MNELIIIFLANIFWALHCFSSGMIEGVNDSKIIISDKDLEFDSDNLIKLQSILYLALITFLCIIFIDYYTIPVILSIILMYRYLKTLFYNCTIRYIDSRLGKLPIKEHLNSFVIGIIILLLTIIYIITS